MKIQIRLAQLRGQGATVVELSCRASRQRIVLWRSYRLAYVDKLVSYVLNLAITKNSFPLPRMIHIYWFASEKRGHRRRAEAFMNNYIDRARESESRNLLLERRDQLAQRRVGRESRVRQRLVRDGRRVVRGQPFLDRSALVAVAVRAPVRRTSSRQRRSHITNTHENIKTKTIPYPRN